MGIEQNDFVKAFILALSDDRVARKLQDAICGQLTKEVCELRDIVKSRDVQVKELKTEIDEMKAILDDHEQYSRRNSLRISGVIEDANEDIVAVTLGFINKELGMATPIVERDIDRVHRLGPRRAANSRPILDKFATYRARQLVFKQKAYLNPRRRTELQAGAWGHGDTSSSDRQSSTTTEQGEGQHVWINEDLTKSRAEMLWRARAAKKDRKIVDCWSSDGRIMIKKSGGEIVQIRRVSDIGK